MLLEYGLKHSLYAKIEAVNTEGSREEVEVLSYTIETMNETKINKNNIPKIKQPMNRSFILKNSFVKYAEGIMDASYEVTDDRCVDYQLTQFLLNPIIGNPTKKIKNGMPVSQDNIYTFFKEYIETRHSLPGINEYPDFSLNSGRSVEMVEALCKFVKRSMYAYDANDKCFHSYINSNDDNNRHYCHLVFY